MISCFFVNFAFSQTGQIKANTGDILHLQPDIVTIQANTDGYGIYATGGGVIYSDTGNIETNGANAAGLFAAEIGSVIYWEGTTITTNGLRGRGIDTVRGGQVIGYGTVITNGDKAHGVQAGDTNSVSGPAKVTLLSGTVVHTSGNGSYGLHAYASGTLSGTASVITEGISSFGAHAEKNSSIILNGSMIETHGLNAIGLLANTDGITPGVSYTPGKLNATNTSVVTTGTNAFGVFADVQASISLANVSVETLGDAAIGLFANRGGTIISQGSVTTQGSAAYGVAAGMVIVPDMIDRIEHHGRIDTSGDGAYGIFAQNEAQLKISGSIETHSELSHGILMDNAYLSMPNLTVNTEGNRAIGLYATNGATLDGQARIATQGKSAHGIMLENGSLAVLNKSLIQTRDVGADGAVIKNSNFYLNDSQLLGNRYGISVADSSVISLINTSVIGKQSAIEATFTKDNQRIELTIGGSSQLYSETGNFLSVTRDTAEAETGRIDVQIKDYVAVSGNILDTGAKTTSFTDVSLGDSTSWDGQAQGIRNFNALTGNSRVKFAAGSHLNGDIKSSNSVFDFDEAGIHIAGNVFLANSSHSDGGASNGPITVAGNVIVDATSTQRGSWSIAGNLENNGLIAPGNSVSTITVGGNYSASDTSTYQVEINGAGASDLIRITGTASLAGKVSVITSGGDSGFIVDHRYTILSATGGLNGTTYNGGLLWNNAPSYLYVAPHLSYDAQNAYLILTRNNAPIVHPHQTQNEQIVGGTIDRSDWTTSLKNALLLQTDVVTVKAALSHLSGELHSALPTALMEDSRFLREAVNERLRQASKAVGGDATSVAVGNSDNASVVNIWAQGFGSQGTWNSTSNTAGMDRSIAGMFVGADTTVDNWQIGALAGYSRSSIDLKAHPSTADTDNYHFGLYAGSQWNSLALRAGLAQTWHAIETHRSVNFPGFSDNLNADYRASTTQIFGELGYGMKAGAYQLEPFANLSYVHINRKSFKESGNDAALTVVSQSMDSIFTTLGARAETMFEISGVSTKARGTVGWKHAFGDTNILSSHAFTTGSTFDIGGASIAKNVAVVEAGLDFALTDNATISLLYSGQLAREIIDQSFKTTLAVKF